MEIEEIARVVVNCGYGLHKELGPGLLESVYEVVLAKLLVEIKSVENLAPVHGKQLLTYLRLLNLRLGLLMNFGSAIFKNGIKRIVNNHSDFAASRLRVHQGLLEDVHT
jgi:iron complex transport system substrate-binding protein